MKPLDEDVERLFEILEEVRLLLTSSLPPAPAPRKKTMSWEDVWRKTSYSVRPVATRTQVSQSQFRLSEQYTKALRALRLTSH